MPYNSKYMQVKAIYLKGCKEPIKDQVIYFTNHFIIAAGDAEETAPTWYNIDAIEKLEGVERYTPQEKAPAPKQPPVWRI